MKEIKSALTINISSSDTQFSITTGSGNLLPKKDFYVKVIKQDTPSVYEIMLCISRLRDILIVERPKRGTIAISHLAGAIVEYIEITAQMLEDVEESAEMITGLATRVPYIGAIADVDLGDYNLITNKLTVSGTAISIITGNGSESKIGGKLLFNNSNAISYLNASGVPYEVFNMVNNILEYAAGSFTFNVDTNAFIFDGVSHTFNSDISFGVNSNKAILNTAALTVAQTFTFPDASGILALQGLAGTKIYYVADESGGSPTRKLTFQNGILVSET